MSQYTWNKLRKILDDPYFEIKAISDRFNGNVPQIKEEPKFSQYGIPNNVLDIIAEQDKSFDKKVSLYMWLLYILRYILFSIILYANGHSFWKSTTIPLGSYAWMAPVAYEILLSNSISSFLEKKKNNTTIHKAYNRYKNDYDAYLYWTKVLTLDYWMNLDGHQFEDAVASVFRKNGYSAVVSKQGGDGGIDIVLKKGTERIAVQCKAHKMAIGPSVARDLLGTMQHYGFEKGMIVSRSGFTSGVREFVAGKNIQLISLNSLLKMYS